MDESKHSVTISLPCEFPHTCILCGEPAGQTVRVRFQRAHRAKKSILKEIFSSLLGDLIADETFDERPIDLHLPVCSLHVDEDELQEIEGKPVGNPKFARRLTLSNVHPKFVAGTEKLAKKQAKEFAKRMGELDQRNRN